MKKVKITVMKTARYTDLIEKYEKPISHACDMREGQIFIANGWKRPSDFCESAWVYDGWMKNKRSAMISCNDGFRPVSFLLETMDADAE